MTELQVQHYLRNSGSLKDLENAYAIKSRRHSKFPNLVLLKYDQINSPFEVSLVQECRGIILNDDDDWNVVARGFDKFFNHGEMRASPIDWSTAVVQEKVDGSLCMLYPWNGEWWVATTGTPDASGNINNSGITFSDLFWQTFDAHRSILPAAHGDWCFLFELTSPFNRVVVPHKESRLTYLAARNRVTGEYMGGPSIWGIPGVRSFPLGSFDDCVASFEKFSGADQEGYVVVDAQGRRVKIKHPSYVALHHMRDGFGAKRILTLLQKNEQAEVLAYFPEFKPLFDEVREKYEALISDIERAYEKHKGIASQKDFALAIKDERATGILFQLRAGKIRTARDGVALMTINSLRDRLAITDDAASSEAA